MTITISPTCANVTIVSDNFDFQNQTVELTVKFNCEDEYLITAEPEDTEIVVDNAALDLDGDTLADGVYYFELKIVQEDSTVITESACRFVNCSSDCLMLDTFKLAAEGDEQAIIKAMAYHALSVANGCTSCACEDLCLLYKATTLINCTNDVKPCGCS